MHQAGEEQHASRIKEVMAVAAEDALKQRIATNKPSPGMEKALRHDIDGLMSGHPDYDIMEPNLAAGTHQMLSELRRVMANWGAVKSVTFTGVGKDGRDNYLVVSQNVHSLWEIGPLAQGGKMATSPLVKSTEQTRIVAALAQA